MKSKLRIGTGASSILMIVITLTLTAFAVLSFVSARSDYRTAQESLRTNEAYYAAEGNVQTLLSEIDGIVQSVSADSSMQQIIALDGSMQQLSQNTVTFSVPVSENREIVVILQITDSSGYRVLLHEFVNTEIWQIDNSLNLWQE